MRAGVGVFLAMGVLGAGLAHGAVFTPFGGSYSGWPGSWTGLLTDSANDLGVANLDLVGMNDVSTPGYAVSWSQDQNYVYFRLQLRANDIAPGIFNNDAVMIYVNNAGDSKPDWGFAWDHHLESNGSSSSGHGVELLRYASGGSSTWENVRMTDVDGVGDGKGSQDFQSNNGDAYLRLQSDLGAGQFSLIDLAVSKTKVAASTDNALAAGQTWQIAAATMRTENDHSQLSDGDIAYGAGGLPSSVLIVNGWSAGIAITAVPEVPASPWLVLGFCGLAVAGSRLRSSFAPRP